MSRYCGVMSAELRADALELADTVDAAGRFVKGSNRAEFYRRYAGLSARKRQAAEVARRVGVKLAAKGAAAAGVPCVASK